MRSGRIAQTVLFGVGVALFIGATGCPAGSDSHAKDKGGGVRRARPRTTPVAPPARMVCSTRARIRIAIT